MKKWISFPHVEGTASGQAHADLPVGTYERGLGREDIFGPATHLYHRHPPSGWSDWEGPVRPRAFDTTRLEGFAAMPREAELLRSNASLTLRFWRAQGGMDHVARNGGDPAPGPESES